MGRKKGPGPAVFPMVWTTWMILTHPDPGVSAAVGSSWEWTCSCLLSWRLGDRSSTFSSPQLSGFSVTQQLRPEGKVNWSCVFQSQLKKNLRLSFGFSFNLLFSYIINVTVCNGNVFSQMQSLLHATLNSPEDAFRNVSDICRMVSYDCSPLPHAGCPPPPVQVLSICLRGSNVPATALLISRPPYKAGAERAKPWPSSTSSFPLFTQTLCAHLYGKSTALSDFVHKL